MMMSFPQYILSLGYTPHRKVWDKKARTFSYEAATFDNHYSTMGNGTLDYRFLKEDKKEIIWGLSEKGKPPTLVWPRPEGIYNDDDMNKLILTLTPAELYNAI